MKNYFKTFGIMFIVAFAIILGNSKGASAYTTFTNDSNIKVNSDIYYQGEQIYVTYDTYPYKLNHSARVGSVLVDKIAHPNDIEIQGMQFIWHESGNIKLDVPKEPGNYKIAIFLDDYNDTYLASVINFQVSSEHLDISLNKSTDNLNVGETDNLAATTSPAAVKVEWKSSDPSIATVDSNGKVTAIKEGQATINAKVTGHDKEATCIINVTDSIFLEMPDGNKYKVTSSQVKDFIQWYNDRENNKSNSQTYKFNSSDIK